MVAVTLIQAGLFYATALFGGTVEQLKRNSHDILNERVINRKNYIENEMLQWRGVVESTALSINQSLETFSHQESVQGTKSLEKDENAAEFLQQISGDVIYMLRKNSVNGAFIILENDPLQPAEDNSHPALYIRDLDPISNSLDNSDLLIETAPTAVARNLKIPMDSWWSPRLQFNNLEGDKGGMFYKPVEAALAHPEIGYQDLGYWSRPYKLNKNDIDVISYSVPLISNDGNPYGVLGIEITLDYFKKLLPNNELSSTRSGSYLLAIDNAENETLAFENILTNGSLYRQINGSQTETRFYPVPVYNNSYSIESDWEEAYGCIQYFQLYNTNTPFEQDRWALVGIVNKRDLLGMAYRVRQLLAISTIISLVIGIVGMCIISTVFTRPVSALVRKLKSSDPQRPVKLDKIYITEIDELSGAIEHMSVNVAQSASKLTQIIEMTGISLGAFEFDKKKNIIFCAGNLFSVLNGDTQEKHSSWTVTPDKFKEKFTSYCPVLEESVQQRNESIYRIDIGQDDHKWYRLKVLEDPIRTLGVVVDITREILEKRKIEYERDYDVLTNLYNRRAFHAIVEKKFEAPENLKISALIMLDLDNLKYINDSYGHDFGDAYIRCAADIMKSFSQYNVLVSRMSGDEFQLFVYGYDNKEQIREIVQRLKEKMGETTLSLPDREKFKIRASAGMAWYPDDADNLELLIKYADFAMYKVKNTIKGEFNEFSISSYNKDAYLLHSKEELNKLIDDRLVQYAFQPIIDTQEGSILAYEALMRSQLETLQSPFEILSLARAQSKLYQIERLTWFKSIEDFVHATKGKELSCKIFINSIPNQILSPQDIQEFESLYAPLLSRLVIELTEEEMPDEDSLHMKQSIAKKWGCQFALDDFGTGYNGEAVLLSFTPQFVKVDMSIIRNINADQNRQRVLLNLVSYAASRNIGVIAEGVETYNELVTAMDCGVRYIQGFYLGKPSFIPQELGEDLRGEILSIQKMMQSTPTNSTCNPSSYIKAQDSP